MKGPDSLTIYLQEIGSIPLLSQAQELVYARRMIEGDQGAKRELVQRNLRFVVHLAKRYAGRGATIDELVSAGNLGLVRGVERYDPGKGCRLLTYASWWIHKAMVEAICENARLVHVPRGDLRRLGRLMEPPQRCNQRTSATLGSSVSWPGKTHDDLAMIIAAAKRPMSLDAPSGYGDGEPPLERLADIRTPSPEGIIVEAAAREILRRSLDLLSPSEALILRRRYGLDGERPVDNETIARMLGVTTTRVRQRVKHALEKLRRLGGTPLRDLVA